MLGKAISQTLDQVNHKLLLKSLNLEAVDYDLEVCPSCDSRKIRFDREIVECLGCGATFITK